MSLFRIIAASVLLVLVSISPAQAQAFRTWVSAGGDDVFPCSRSAPCRTFVGAYSKTAAGGEISVLDQLSVTIGSNITKSITITGVGQQAAIDFTNSAGAAITIAVSSSDRVVIRNLALNGMGLGGDGIRLRGGTLVIEDSRIENFVGSRFTYPASTATGQGSPVIIIRNTTFNHNAVGIDLPGGGSAVTKIIIDDSLIFDTQQVALRADGANNSMVINRSFISGSLGKDIEATNGATVTSLGDNRLRGAGNPTGLLAKQ